jgi:pyruvate/2-oxoglutarate/acetoin dehydrogenase E1 component
MGKKNSSKTVAETICKLSKNLIDKHNGVIIGQCLTAVGWVQNTVPKQKNAIYELQMTDTSGAGIAVGCALAGSRPILVIRFQSFLWLNSSPIIMHAGIAKEIFGYGCPVLIRAIASESADGQGPLHANNYHSIFLNVPGVSVCAPMTPNEYKEVWNYYLKHDAPLLISEHRNSYKSSLEIKNIYNKNDFSDATIFAISSSRFSALTACKNVKDLKLNLINIVWLNPLKFKKKDIETLKKSKIGLVIDASYEYCGVTESIAYKLQALSNVPVYAMGLKNKLPGVNKINENGTPAPMEILDKIRHLIKKK